MLNVLYILSLLILLKTLWRHINFSFYKWTPEAQVYRTSPRSHSSSRAESGFEPSSMSHNTIMLQCQCTIANGLKAFSMYVFKNVIHTHTGVNMKWSLRYTVQWERTSALSEASSRGTICYHLYKTKGQGGDIYGCTTHKISLKDHLRNWEQGGLK